jgi:hypothetical protein
MRTHWTLRIIWLCFILRLMFYVSALPIWEGFDEYAHFALVQYVVNHAGGFPLGAVPPDESEQVSQSRKLTPGPWTVHDQRTGVRSYEEYFSLPEPERASLRVRLQTMPVDWRQQKANPPELIYETQQPPAYYWLLAPFYWISRTWSLPASVWLLRFVTALIASVTVPLTFSTARLLTRNNALALGTALLVASFPEIYVLAGQIGNNGLSIAIGAIFLWVSVGVFEGIRRPIWLGIALGVALLTKAYFLALTPLAALILWRARSVTSAIAAFAIGGWWYVRNILVTHTVTGQIEDMSATATSRSSIPRAFTHMDWRHAFDWLAVSHIWVGGWSFLMLRAWMYRAVEFILIAALIGLAMQLFRPRKELPLARQVLLIALPFATMVLGLCFHALQVYRTRGVGETLGYYLYALVSAEAILLAAGLLRLWPGPRKSLTIAFTAFALVAIEQYALWFVLLPYYGGLTRHTPTGSLPAARLQYFQNGGIRMMFDHLSGIGPLSNSSTLQALAAAYALGTIALLWTCSRISKGTPIEAGSRNSRCSDL